MLVSCVFTQIKRIAHECHGGTRRILFQNTVAVNNPPKNIIHTRFLSSVKKVMLAARLATLHVALIGDIVICCPPDGSTLMFRYETRQTVEMQGFHGGRR